MDDTLLSATSVCCVCQEQSVLYFSGGYYCQVDFIKWMNLEIDAIEQGTSISFRFHHTPNGRNLINRFELVSEQVWRNFIDDDLKVKIKKLEQTPVESTSPSFYQVFKCLCSHITIIIISTLLQQESLKDFISSGMLA